MLKLQNSENNYDIQLTLVVLMRCFFRQIPGSFSKLFKKQSEKSSKAKNTSSLSLVNYIYMIQFREKN